MIKIRQKHIFNPANFGVLLVSVIFGAAHTWWISSPLILVLILVFNAFSKPAKENVSEVQVAKEPVEIQEMPTGEQLNQTQEIPARAEPKVEDVEK